PALHLDLPPFPTRRSSDLCPPTSMPPGIGFGVASVGLLAKARVGSSTDAPTAAPTAPAAPPRKRRRVSEAWRAWRSCNAATRERPDSWLGSSCLGDMIPSLSTHAATETGTAATLCLPESNRQDEL